MNRCLMYTLFFLLGLLICVVVPSDAQGHPPTQDQMAEVLKYSGVENPPATEMDRLLELWKGAQKPGIAQDERVRMFRDMYLLFMKLRGRDMSNHPETLTPLAAFAANAFHNGARMDLTLPPRALPAGNYLHTQTFGKGRRPLLLISDAGVDGRKLFATFIARNQAKYTMHVVTLPGAGAAKPLPWPPTADPTRKVWVTHIEQELLQLVDARKWKDVTVIGPSIGGYFAARLALERPAAFRAAVLVDALVNVIMRSTRDPDAPATLEERINRAQFRPPFQFFPLGPIPEAGEVRRLLDHPNPNHPSVQNWMNFAVKDDAVSKQWTFDALSTGFFVQGLWYGAEMGATDLTADLQKLTVPMLAMAAWHDDGSRGQSPPSHSQWLELKMRNPKLPITIASFADTRSYIMADEPAAFDAALDAFLAGRTPEGKKNYLLPRASPRASVRQWIGSAEVEVVYGRPRVNDRKVWGAVLPYGRVWRAGANEATTISFSTPVTVEGKPLAAGTYTLFAIPTEKDWTIIFNRIPAQWGAFSYNPEFDALRVTLTPAGAPHEEYLSYAFEVTGANAGRLTLRWEKRQVSLAIESSPGNSK